MPQPDEIIEAMNKESMLEFENVNPSLLHYFDSAADKLIAESNNDSRLALKKSLALVSGIYR